MLPESAKKKFEEQYGVFIREYGDLQIKKTRGKKVVGSSTRPKIVEKNERSTENVEGDIEETLSKW